MSSTQAPSFLSREEIRTLEAVCLALVPSIPPMEGGDDAGGLLSRSASDLEVARLLVEVLGAESPDTHAQFRRLLAMFGSAGFGLLASGRPKGFADLDPRLRERVLQRMSTSAIPVIRQAFQAVKRPSTFLFYSAPVGGDANPNWAALGYAPTRPPRPIQVAPKPIRTLAVTADVELTADAVVIGSGAGGSVVAAKLAAAGSDVVVLEMGDYLNEADFTGMEAEMTPRLFLGRGLLSTSDLGMVVLAGSCLGGGTVVNWSDSLRTPADVLDEWEHQHGLEGVTGSAYQQAFELVERRMNVNVLDSAPNQNNAALQRGCEALGYHWDPIPRNASGCEQRCGGCQFGCPFGCKRTALLTFLQDAHDRGARIISGCRVERVLFRQGRAAGVEAQVAGAQPGQQHRVVVRAPTVVVAGGGVESPAVLLRSGLDNPNIGRHLRLHPVTAVAGFYSHPIQARLGSPQTIKTDQFAPPSRRLRVPARDGSAHPGIIAMGTSWGGRAAAQAADAAVRQRGDLLRVDPRHRRRKGPGGPPRTGGDDLLAEPGRSRLPGERHAGDHAYRLRRRRGRGLDHPLTSPAVGKRCRRPRGRSEAAGWSGLLPTSLLEASPQTGCHCSLPIRWEAVASAWISEPQSPIRMDRCTARQACTWPTPVVSRQLRASIRCCR